MITVSSLNETLGQFEALVLQYKQLLKDIDGVNAIDSRFSMYTFTSKTRDGVDWIRSGNPSHSVQESIWTVQDTIVMLDKFIHIYKELLSILDSEKPDILLGQFKAWVEEQQELCNTEAAKYETH